MSPTGSKEINYENIFNLLRSNFDVIYEDLRNKLHEEVDYKQLLKIGEEQFFNVTGEIKNETEPELSNLFPANIELLTAAVDEKIDSIIHDKFQGDFRSSFKEEVLKSVLSYKSMTNNHVEKPVPESELPKYELRVVLEKIDDLSSYCTENINDIMGHDISEKTEFSDAEDNMNDNNNSSERINKILLKGIKKQSEYCTDKESQEKNLNYVSENEEPDSKNVRFLRAKWTNLRDGARKSFRKLPNCAKYRYSDKLQFLYKSFEHEENFSVARKSNALTGARHTRPNKPIGRPSKHRMHSQRRYIEPPSPPESASENEKSIPSPIEVDETENQPKVKTEVREPEQTHEKKVMPDEDEAFFISIMPSVKRLSDDEKLEFRMGVLGTIRDIKRQSFMVDASSTNTPLINSHSIAYPTQFITPDIPNQAKSNSSA